MCSDLAQLHWTRLYSAANNYARFELNYRKVVSAAYSSFKNPPTEAQFWGWIREYRDCFLLFVYEVNEVWWGQWQTNERYLLGHKNAEDRRSPAPPAEEQEKYRQTYAALKKQRVLKNQGLADLLGVVPSRNELGENAFAGVGVGEGVGEVQKPTPNGVVPTSPRAEEFANAWNRHRGSLPKVAEFTESRRKKVQARIRQGITVERFSEAVKLCTSMPFLLGNNPRGWVATFDWLVENDRNLAKVLEGNYKDSGAFNGNASYAKARTGGNASALEEVLKRQRDRAVADEVVLRQTSEHRSEQPGLLLPGTIDAELPRRSGGD